MTEPYMPDNVSPGEEREELEKYIDNYSCTFTLGDENGECKQSLDNGEIDR